MREIHPIVPAHLSDTEGPGCGPWGPLQGAPFPPVLSQHLDPPLGSQCFDPATLLVSWLSRHFLGVFCVAAFVQSISENQKKKNPLIYARNRFHQPIYRLGNSSPGRSGNARVHPAHGWQTQDGRTLPVC